MSNPTGVCTNIYSLKNGTALDSTGTVG